MLIDRILYPIVSLGPGKRIVIWTVGCSKHCNNCTNPELWKFDKNKNVSVEAVINFVKDIVDCHIVDGITITGGDPLEQLDDLINLVEQLEIISEDILVYTGFEYKCFSDLFSDEKINRLKNKIAVLIDGKYIDSQNDNKSPLIGSTNQKIFFLKEKFREKYKLYSQEERKIQNIYYGKQMISVGIHNKAERE